MTNFQNVPIAPRDADAIRVFHAAVDAPLLLVRSEIERALYDVKGIDLLDIFCAGFLATSRAYLPYVAPVNKPIPAETWWIVDTGLAGFAGNAPEICTQLGLDPVALASIGRFLSGDARVGRGISAPRISEESRRELTDPFVANLHLAALQANLLLTTWIDRKGRSSKRKNDHPHLAELDAYFLRSMPFPIDREGEEAVFTRLKEQKRIDDIESIDDLIADGLIHRLESPSGEGYLPVLVGEDRRVRLNVGYLLDPARRVTRRSAQSRGHLDLVALESDGQAQVEPSPADVVAEREQDELTRLAAMAVEAEALDEVDRQIVELAKHGEQSRAARARALGMSPAGLRKREKLLGGRARAATADEALRSMLQQRGRAG